MLKVFPKNYVVFDFETNGFDPVLNEVTQMSALKVVNGKREHFTTLVQIYGHIPDEVQKLTGITDELLREKGIPKVDAWKKLHDFLYDNAEAKITPLIGHNSIRFDMLFMNENWRRLQLPLPPATHHIDTAMMYKAMKLGLERDLERESFFDFARRVGNIWAKGVKYNLQFCCSEFEIDCSSFTAHQADSDVLMTEALYHKFQDLYEA